MEQAGAHLGCPSYFKLTAIYWNFWNFCLWWWSLVLSPHFCKRANPVTHTSNGTCVLGQISVSYWPVSCCPEPGLHNFNTSIFITSSNVCFTITLSMASNSLFKFYYSINGQYDSRVKKSYKVLPRRIKSVHQLKEVGDEDMFRTAVLSTSELIMLRCHTSSRSTTWWTGTKRQFIWISKI